MVRPIEQRLIPRWGTRLVSDITRRDIIELLDEIMDEGTPIAANRTLALVRKFFNWCIERDILEASPCIKIPPPGEEIERDRVLSDNEVRTLWSTWDDMGWRDIDLENKVWRLPAEMTKAFRSHDVPLSTLAMEILDTVPCRGEYVLTTTNDRPVSGFSRAKQRAEWLSEVSDWRLHDLRRTCATRMTQLGVPVFIVGRLLNHAPRSAVGITSTDR